MIVSLLALTLGCSDKSARDSDSQEDTHTTAEAAGVLDFSGEPPSNLIILSIDTLRRDALGRYGGAATPNLDRLLSEGVALEDHRSCSNWTYASMLCVLSGQTTDQLGFEPLHQPTGEPDPLDPGFTLLGHLLEGLGMTGAIATTNVFLSDTFHTTAGYTHETFDSTLDAAGIVDAGLSLHDRLPEDRWLLHLHFIDPHDPYAPPADYQDELEGLDPIAWDLTDTTDLNELRNALAELDEAERALVTAHLQARYDGLTRYVDDQIGRFLEELESRGALDDALILVLTDHGEQLIDHGELGHGLSLFNEETRAAAGFWAKSLTPLAWTAPTSHVDLLPTLGHALGWELTLPFSGGPVGASEEAAPVLVHRYARESTLQSVVYQGEKLVLDWQTGYRLYNLSDDPDERTDLAESDPHAVARLGAWLTPQTEALIALYPDYAPSY